MRFGMPEGDGLRTVPLWIVVLFLGLAGLSGQRARVWRSDRTLWADAIAKAPNKARPHVNLGRQYEIAGSEDWAAYEYRTALRLAFRPEVPPQARRVVKATVEVNTAHLLMRQGKAASAMRILDGVITDWPTFPYAHYNRGVILRALGACAEAAKEYEAAYSYDPTLPTPEPCVPSPPFVLY